MLSRVGCVHSIAFTAAVTLASSSIQTGFVLFPIRSTFWALHVSYSILFSILGTLLKRFPPDSSEPGGMSIITTLYLVLSQCSKGADAALDKVEHPGADSQHHEHGNDKQEDFDVERQKRFRVQEPAAHGIQSIGERERHCDRDKPGRQRLHREARPGEALHKKAADVHQGIGFTHQKDDPGKGKTEAI